MWFWFSIKYFQFNSICKTSNKAATLAVSVHAPHHIRQAPQYLSDCVSTISEASGRYRLRSTGSAVYVPQRTRTRYGECGFFHFGPATWNILPSNLHDITDTSTFRKQLKNVLFDSAYNWLLLALLNVSCSGVIQISWVARALPRTPVWELTALPRLSCWWGASCRPTLTRTPYLQPLLAIWASGSNTDTMTSRFSFQHGVSSVM